MAGIGETLREARVRAHLDIVDFEARTKIRAKYLRALEDEEWSLLPGYTFTKGFLRTYADMLGLDGRALVDEFKRQYRDPSELEPVAPSQRRDAARRARERPRDGDRGGRPRRPVGSGRPPLIVGAVLLIAAIVVVLYAVGVVLPRKAGAPTSTTDTNTVASRTSHTRATPPPATHAPRRRRVAVQFVPRAPVYVCMVGYPGASNRRGRVRINGKTLVPGAFESVYHDNHFRITLGNSSIVLVVNRHRHLIAPSTSSISLEVTARGRVLPLTALSQVPHCT